MTEISICERQGHRGTMEDRHIVNTDLLKDGGSVQIFAVFDGHGGDATAQFLEENFENVLIQKLSLQTEKDYCAALRSAFRDCDDQLGQKYQLEQNKPMYQRCEDSGSTAVVVLIVNNLEIYCANVGDSEAIIFDPQMSNYYLLSQIHKPGSIEERARIERDGGYVVNFGGTPRTNGNLAISRSFGDFFMHSKNGKKVISSEPHTWKGTLSNKDLMVLACDGLWDVYDYIELALECVDYFDKEANNSTSNCAKFIVEKAINERYSGDNVSAIVVRFHRDQNNIVEDSDQKINKLNITE